MSSPKSLTKKKKLFLESFSEAMGEVLAKESDQRKSSAEDESWDNREDADGASSVEEAFIRDIKEQVNLNFAEMDDRQLMKSYTHLLKLSEAVSEVVGDDVFDSDDSGTQCDCEACQEPIMSIRNPHFDRVQEHWQTLRKFIQIVYKVAAEGKTLDPSYHKQIQCIIHELVALEPNLLYKQLEAQIQEWVIETELRQLEHLLETNKADDIAHLFISGLLESYQKLMAGAALAFPILEELEKVHLFQFNMTWTLLNEHIYQSCVYADALVQNNVPAFISSLSHTSESMESNKDLVREFLKLDDSINAVASQWVHCERRLEQYAEEQAEIEGKRTLLELEWKSFKEGGKTALINKTLKKIVTSEKKSCIHKNGSCKTCKSSTSKPHKPGRVALVPCICTGSLHQSGSIPQCKNNPPDDPNSGQMNGNLPSDDDSKSESTDSMERPTPVPKSSKTDTPEAHVDVEKSPRPNRPPTPPQSTHTVKAPPTVTHSHAHTQSHSVKATNTPHAHAHAAKPKTIDVGTKCIKPRNCHKVKQPCTHHHAHMHPHKHTHGEPIKRIPACDHRFTDDDESDGTSPPDDSCSDKSSTSTQKGSGGDPRHCDCCYCEVFGHGMPSGAPVSRNYQEIRERLRLLLNKKKNINNKKVNVDNSQPKPQQQQQQQQHQHPPQQQQQHQHQTVVSSELLNKLPPLKQKQQIPPIGVQDVDEILNFIEGNTKVKDSKKAAKKARQKEKKLQEMYQKKLEEEAAERAKLEAEKRRKEELLREKERLIKEQERLERELRKQNEKLNNNRKALSVKNSNENNINNNDNNSSKKNKKGNKQQQSQETQQQNKKNQQQLQSQNKQMNGESAANKKNKQKKNSKDNESDSLVAQNANRIGVTMEANPNAPKMVTIKRVMEPTSGAEPTVTITLRGATPSEDKVLYTLQNGHVCPLEEKKNAALKTMAANNNNTATNDIGGGKLSKKQQKKLNQQLQKAKQNQQQPEPVRQTQATHVQHSPGVVEINVNGGPNMMGASKMVNGKTNNQSNSIHIQNNSAINGKKKDSVPQVHVADIATSSGLTSGFSSTSVINVKPNSLNQPMRKQTPPVAQAQPSVPPQLTTSTAIQISNAITSLTNKHDFNIEDLKLPPGITITKVESPHNTHEDYSKSSVSGDGGDSDNLNKENASNTQALAKKKNKKNKTKEPQQELCQQIYNGHLPNSINSDSPTIYKVKGSMVSIRNSAVFPDDLDLDSAQQSVKPFPKKGRGKDARPDEWSLVDEESVFAPKDIDLENGDIDDAERELEAFKRFCSQSVPPKQKEKVHLNIKDIILKKKRDAISCS